MTTTHTEGLTAEDYLRQKYGAYRGHHCWRELEEAFNAGRAAQPSEAAIRNAALEEAKKAACQYAEKEAGSIDQQGYHRAAANNIFHIIHALQSSNASDAAQPVKGE